MPPSILLCDKAAIAAHYQRMRADGLGEAGIDGANGAPADGRIACDEVVDAALSRARQYRPFFQALTSRPVPWFVEDAAAGAKISAAIALAKGRLARQKIAPESERYRSRLATTLYIFAYAPSPERQRWARRYNPSTIAPLFSLLRYYGMSEIAAFIAKQGGLGLADFHGDAEVEATATEALRDRRGMCTEKSKILFDLLDRAGLDPFFAFMSARDLSLIQARMIGSGVQPSIPPDDYLMGHIFIGVPNSADPIYFEPNHFFPDAPYDQAARRLSLREMYHADLGNLTGHLVEEERLDEAERFIRGAQALGPTPFTSYVIIRDAVIHLKRRQPMEAERLLHEAVRLSHDPHHARVFLCDLLLRSNQLEGARQCFAILPDHAPFKFSGLGETAFQQGRHRESIAMYEQGLKLGLDPHASSMAMARACAADGDSACAKEHWRKALKIEPRSREAQAALASALLAEGRAAEAIPLLKRTLALASSDAEALAMMARALIASGKMEEARHSFRRYLHAVADGGTFTIEAYETSADIGEKLRAEQEVRLAARAIADRAEGDAFAALAACDAASRMPELKARAKEEFGAIVALIAKNGGLPFLPPRLYGKLASLAERLGAWDRLALLCKTYEKHPAYSVLGLHAAWKSGGPGALNEAANRLLDLLDLFGTIPPPSREPRVLRELAQHLASFPEELKALPPVQKAAAALARLIAQTP